MESGGALLTLAEVSVAMAGFAGIVMAVLTANTERNVQDLWGLAYVLTSSGLVLLFSMVPFVLTETNITEALALKISSGAHAGVLLGILLFVTLSLRRIKPRYPLTLYVMMAIGYALSILALASALDWIDLGSMAIALLVWTLFAGFAQFSVFVIMAWSRR